MSKRDLRGIEDFSSDDVAKVFALARTLKDEVKQRIFRPLLSGCSLAMFFEKPSLRTRSTFDLGIFQLGGHSVYFQPNEVGLGHRESIPDAARNLERWFDMIMARVFSQSTVDELARYCSKPVINALSDHEHPCQALTDLFTLQENVGTLDDKCLAYVGDGNNVTHSLMLLAAKVGLRISIATPAGYAPNATVVQRAREMHPLGEKGISLFEDPHKAVENCSAVYTDVWASMGQEAEAEERARIFAPYQLNAALLSRAKQNAKVMHCLPAHRGLEITDEVMDSPNSIVFDQAENRLHVQKAIMVYLFEQSKND